MALEDTFRKQFAIDAVNAVRTGNKAAWYVAIGIGGSACMPLLAQGEICLRDSANDSNVELGRCGIHVKGIYELSSVAPGIQSRPVLLDIRYCHVGFQ